MELYNKHDTDLRETRRFKVQSSCNYRHAKDVMCSSRKYPYSPHRWDWNFLGSGGSGRPKNIKKCMKLEFPEGWGGVRKNPFRGGGMDIFWN